ncbi:MAG: FAD/NAD(P)-binding oxidoreductase [Cyclobacteriaceae bacterium]
MSTILILGGGVGGIVTANKLRKQLGKEHRIIVIDKQKDHVFAPSLLWLMVGLRKPEKIKRELKRIERKGIEYVNGEIEHIDPSSKHVVVNGQTYSGDYLVISLGAELKEVDGLNKAGHNFYTLNGAQNLYNDLKNFKAGKVAVLVSSAPYKCPAAPYEASLLLLDHFKKRKLTDHIELSLYAPEPGPMGVAGKELSGAVRQLVESKGIKYFPEHQFKAVKNNALKFTNGLTEHFDLLAYVPKHQCPRVIRESKLISDGDWIKLKDRETLETDFPKVFAIGDITGISLAMGKPLPKAGVFAHYQAEIVAHNIAVDIMKKGQKKRFTGNGECFIELGGNKAGFAKGNFYNEPLPKIKMHKPSFIWHWGKVIFEKGFLRRWF